VSIHTTRASFAARNGRYGTFEELGASPTPLPTGDSATSVVTSAKQSSVLNRQVGCDQPCYKPNGWGGGLSDATFLRGNPVLDAAPKTMPNAPPRATPKATPTATFCMAAPTATPKHRPKLMPTPVRVKIPEPRVPHHRNVMRRLARTANAASLP
jgi:hypothetical protein